MASTTLYKKDSKGNVVVWSIHVDYVKDYAQLLISYGRLGHRKAVSNVTITKGKNIGKSNETSPLDQAEAQAGAMITAKINNGYRSLKALGIDPKGYVPQEVADMLRDRLPDYSEDVNGNRQPMLCKEYFKSKKNWIGPDGKLWADRKYYYTLNYNAFKADDAVTINFPALIQPKLNGVRCHVSLDDMGNVVLRSKNGIEFNIPHISKLFEDRIEVFTYVNEVTGDSHLLTFDGELYIHGMVLGDVVSAVKGNNANTLKLSFVGYDIAVEGLTNQLRIIILNDLLGDRSRFEGTAVRVVETTTVSSDKGTQNQTDQYIRDGYEGAVLRDPKAKYEFGKRPATMVKLKRSLSEEFKIVDIVPQHVDPDLGMYKCVTKKGLTFEVAPHLSKGAQKELLVMKQKMIGKLLTCDFYEWTKVGKPFHILHNVVRDYE